MIKRLDDCIEVYLPKEYINEYGCVEEIDKTIYADFKDELINTICTKFGGCSEREEIGYYKSNEGFISKMNNTIVYFFISNISDLDSSFLSCIHSAIITTLKQECSMIVINKSAKITRR